MNVRPVMRSVTKSSVRWEGENVPTKHDLAVAVSEAEALEPRTLKEARERPDWPLWEKRSTSLRCCMPQALGCPPGTNVVGSKWEFKAKKDASGDVILRYKARPVAQGFSPVDVGTRSSRQYLSMALVFAAVKLIRQGFTGVRLKDSPS